MKILIVDDNKNIREMIKSILANENNQLFECDDGIYSLDMCTKYNPDCILMDYKMKYLDGITATRNIKAKYPAVKIIMVTNYSNDDIAVESVKAGAEELIPKEKLYLLPQIIFQKFNNEL